MLSINCPLSPSWLKSPVPPNNQKSLVVTPIPASIEKNVYLLLVELAFNLNSVVWSNNRASFTVESVKFIFVIFPSLSFI